MALLKTKDLTFQYPGATGAVIKDASIEINEGDFTVICGPSGCGKTTLLRLLKRELAPHGEMDGSIYYQDKPLNDWDEKRLMEDIGFVFQNPENQIVMDEVIQELVFGMENLNYSQLEMHKRMAEMVSFFGLEELLDRKPSTLSGGQKQLINLLSILLLKPKVLLLDEPTSQLDPVAAKELMTILERLNKEMGMTIVLVEHRLEELFSVLDYIYMMDQGMVIYQGVAKEVIVKVYQESNNEFKYYLPTVSRIYMEKQLQIQQGNIPLTVKEGRRWIQGNELIPETNVTTSPIQNNPLSPAFIELKGVYYRYAKDEINVLENLQLKVPQGEFFTLVGGNGSGKSTLLKACLGLVTPQRGSIKVNGKRLHKKGNIHQLYRKIAYLPQNPQAYFMQDTILDEMKIIVREFKIGHSDEKIEELLQLFEISHLRDRHPYDCSGGEMGRAALACMLLSNPIALFIDEPTKGLDPLAKRKLGQYLTMEREQSLSIFMVTHDIEFAATYADRCAMLFQGQITAIGTPEELFKGNYFYTTVTNRMTKETKLPESLTYEEALNTWPNPVFT